MVDHYEFSLYNYVDSFPTTRWSDEPMPEPLETENAGVPCLGNSFFPPESPRTALRSVPVSLHRPRNGRCREARPLAMSTRPLRCRHSRRLSRSEQQSGRFAAAHTCRDRAAAGRPSSTVGSRCGVRFQVREHRSTDGGGSRRLFLGARQTGCPKRDTSSAQSPQRIVEKERSCRLESIPQNAAVVRVHGLHLFL